MRTAPPARTQRRDGWTPERQLIFLDALARTRSVRAAAAAAGMSRESGYRLRARPEGALFAHLWDLTLAPEPAAPRHESHMTNREITRFLSLLNRHHPRSALPL